MHLEPLPGYLTLSLLPSPAVSATLLVVSERADLAREAVVIRGEFSSIARGDRVLFSYRQAIQVGSELLVPQGAILAKLDSVVTPQ